MRSFVALIGNPAARKASQTRFAEARDFLRARGFEPEVHLTAQRGDAEALARALVTRNPQMIIAAGGDGTINEVMNGMVYSSVPLALLPLGTTNVLAKELGLPEDLQGSLGRAVSSVPKRVSLGKIVSGTGPSRQTRFFCLMAGVGFDGMAVHNVGRRLKKLSGRAAYVVSGIRTFAAYAPEALVAGVNGEEYPCFAAIICKSSMYGGRMVVAPEASIMRPSLWAAIFRGGTRRDLLRYVFGITRSSLGKVGGVALVETSEVRIEGIAHIQIDGDYLGLTPAEISIAEDALSMIF